MSTNNQFRGSFGTSLNVRPLHGTAARSASKTRSGSTRFHSCRKQKSGWANARHGVSLRIEPLG